MQGHGGVGEFQAVAKIGTGVLTTGGQPGHYEGGGGGRDEGSIMRGGGGIDWR